MPTQEEKKLIQEFENPANVVESASLFDSILISAVLTGQDANVPGWYTTFLTFAQAREHKFFKSRTAATANDAYCNLESSDSLTFPFMAYSMGISFHSPAPNVVALRGVIEGEPDTIIPALPDPIPPHIFAFDLPNHCAVSLKTNQDTRAEVQCYACPPGYGSIGGGCAAELNTVYDNNGLLTKPYKQRAQLLTFGTQGVPVISNRYKFPSPIAIPKNASIEGELHLSDYARDLIGWLSGPRSFVLQTGDEISNQASFFGQRYVITLSLFGKRLVQQRGQYHV